MRAIFLVLPLLVTTTCKSESNDGAKAPAIVKRITESTQLIGGVDPAGRVGDILISNGRVRFIIQDAGSATGWGLYGGSIVDLDVEGGTGDRLQEIFFHCDLRAFAPNRVEIINDGTDGNAGIVRFIGRDGGFPLLDAVLPSSPLAIETTVELTLARDSDTLEIAQRARDLSKTPRDLFCGVIVIRGDAYGGFADKVGFEIDKVSGDIDWVAASAPQASASFVLYRPTGSMGTLAPQSEVLILDTGTRGLLATDTREERYLLSVGNGDVESALTAMRKRRPDGANRSPVEIELVAPASLKEQRDRAVLTVRDMADRARTAAHVDPSTGVATVALAPGMYDVTVTLDGRSLGRHTIDASAGRVPIELGAVGVVSLKSFARVGGQRAPTAAKITIHDGHDAVAGSGRRDRRYVTPTDRFWLPAGDYTLVGSRGPEYELALANVTVRAGQAIDVELVIDRAVDSAGWIAGDFHVHGAKSMDADASRRTRVIAAVAEGLDLLVSTDHDITTDYAPYVRALGLDAMLATAPGIEVSPLYGHMNGYPVDLDDETYWDVRWWTYDADEKFSGTLEPAAVLQNLRDKGAKVTSINHPRQGQGVFDFLQLDANGQTQRTWPNPDAFELMNDTSDSDIPQLMLDWFGLIRAGRRITALGVSDAHGEFGLGYSRTMIASRVDDPAALVLDDVWAAMRGGRAFATTGPFVKFAAVRGTSRAGIGEVLTGGGPLSLEVEVHAPSWMELKTVTILQNGQPVVSHTLTPADQVAPSVRLATTFTATPAADSFYILRVEGSPGTRNEPVMGAQARAITNPVWLDVAGDGLNF